MNGAGECRSLWSAVNCETLPSILIDLLDFIRVCLRHGFTYIYN